MFDIKVLYDYHLNKPSKFFHNIAYIDIFSNDFIVGVYTYDDKGLKHTVPLDITGVRHISVYLDGKRLYSINLVGV